MLPLLLHREHQVHFGPVVGMAVLLSLDWHMSLPTAGKYWCKLKKTVVRKHFMGAEQQ